MRNDMKKVFLTVICLVAAVAAAQAQEIKDRAAYTLNIDRALWYKSGNAAGLARTDAYLWRDASLGFGVAGGAFTDSWGARTQTDLSLKASTLMNIEGFKLAAKVGFDREHLSRAMYNTSVFEPAWDMPYFVALNSDETFNWGRTSATIDLSAATPVMISDMMTFGLNLKADYRRAAKNTDPHSRYNSFELAIGPSATVAIDENNIVGLNVKYVLRPAGSRLYTKGDEVVSVAVMHGLGTFNPRWVGGTTGVGRLSYSGSAIAVGLQYNRKGDESDWLFDVSLERGSTRVQMDLTTLGSVDRFLTEASLQGLMGDDRNQKLNFKFKYNLNYWLNGSETPTTVARNNFFDISADYTVYTGTTDDHDFDWLLGAGIDFGSIRSSRFVPDASLSAIRVMPGVFLGKDSAITQESSLLVRLDVGYNFAINAKYNYAGEVAPTNYIVNYMFDDEVDYLGTYYMRTMLDATYTYHLNTMLSPYAGLKAGLITPMGQKKSRLLAGICIGVMF